MSRRIELKDADVYRAYYCAKRKRVLLAVENGAPDVEKTWLCFKDGEIYAASSNPQSGEPVEDNSVDMSALFRKISCLIYDYMESINDDKS